jgi:hypothetical protein
VNGFVCKDPVVVNADDFFMAAKLDKPRDTMTSKVGSNVTQVNVMQILGLTLFSPAAGWWDTYMEAHEEPKRIN